MSLPVRIRRAANRRVGSNSWYRVKPFIIISPEGDGEVLKFKHPVANTKEDDGWMKPPKKEEASAKSKEKSKTFSLEEIAKHDGTNVSLIDLLSRIIFDSLYDFRVVLPGSS